MGEQQTISIAKAGITTTLNSRFSILAAANSVFGRWDDTKAEENIDFMPTILSRFDTIFIVKDEHDEGRDGTLAKHVMQVHMNAAADTAVEGELSLAFLKKYIAYCRSRCGPRLEQAAAEKLKNRYVLMRNSSREVEEEGEKRLAIPITVRQLEAVVRISESLAKMALQPFVTDANEEEQELIHRIEKQLKKRFPIGAQVSQHSIVSDFEKQKYPERQVQKVLATMIRRGELQHRMQRKMLYRIK